MILIYQTRSNNTNYALVPTFGSKDDGSIDMFLFGKHCFCFSHNTTANILTHSIFPVQFCSDGFRFRFIFGDQKLNGRLSVFQTTNCIKTGSQNKANIFGRNAFAITTASFNQSLQTNKGSTAHGF